MSKDIGGMFKSLKAQVKQGVGNLTQPRPPQPGSQQPPQMYGQQQFQQQYQPQGAVYGSQNPQLQQGQQVQYQQQTQQQTQQLQPQYASSPQVQQGQVFAQNQQFVPQVQTQNQMQSPMQPQSGQPQYQQYQPQPQYQQIIQPVTSPSPQVQNQFQPQYQNQVQQQIPPIQSQQFASPTPSITQSHPQYQSPISQAPLVTQYQPQPTPTPVNQYSPASATSQIQGRRQSQIVAAPQQYSPNASNTQVLQNAPLGQPVQAYQTQPSVHSPANSLARMSFHSPSPVQLQQHSTPPQHYQPIPPSGPPPAHLVQSAPPPGYQAQLQNQVQQSARQPMQFTTAHPPQPQQQTSLPGQPLAQQQQYVPSPIQNHVQAQMHPQSSTPSPHLHQVSPPSSSPPPQLVQYQTSIQPPVQQQELTQQHRNSVSQIPYQQQAQYQQYTQATDMAQNSGHPQVQQFQPASPQQAVPLQGISGQGAQDTPQTQPNMQTSPVNDSPSSQFHAQIRNSVRRKPIHPAQSTPSPTQAKESVQPTAQVNPGNQSQPQKYSPKEQQTPVVPPEARVLSPLSDPPYGSQELADNSPSNQQPVSSIPSDARVLSPLSDPSPYQFEAQFAELADRPHSELQADKPLVDNKSTGQQATTTAMEPPVIESEFNAIETLAPKPIHPPAPIQQYAPSPPQQESQVNSLPSAQIPQAQALSTVAAMPVYAEISAEPVAQNQSLHGHALQHSQSPVVESEPTIAVVSAQQTHVVQPITFVPHDQLHNEKLPVPAAEDDASQPRPTYQAYAPRVDAQKPEVPHNIVLSQDSQGQPSYQPYSHGSPSKQESQPIHGAQNHEISQPSETYHPYVPMSQAQPIPAPENPPQIPPKVSSPSQSITTPLPDIHPSQYQTSATLSHPPLPPLEPCPVHLRNQTPPPASYFQQFDPIDQTPIPAANPAPLVSPEQYSVQAVSPETPKVPHIVDYQGSSRVCSGRKAVLTKYTKFYIPTNDLVPRLDPSTQELSCAICEACFLTNIAQHPSFPANFEVFVSPDLAKSSTDDAPIPISRATCQFGLFPTVKKVYHDKCLSEGSIYPVINTMREFNALPPCPGNEAMNGGEYYTSPAIPHSTFCTQCFEAHLKPSAFASQFTMKLTGPGQQWQCDNGRDPAYSSRIVGKYLYSQLQDFAAFSKAFNEKAEVSPCPGVDRPVLAGPDGKIHVFTIKGTNNTICLECFYDRVKLTPLEHYFTEVSHDPAESATTCDLAPEISRFLFTAAFEAHDLRIWERGLQTFNRIPKCEGVKGVEEEIVEKQAAEFQEEANWYHLTQYPNIEACPCCFHSVISPLGGAHLFTPISRQLRAGIVRTCNFSVGNGGVTSTNPDDFPYTLYFRGFILRHLLEIGWESKQNDYAPFLSIAKSLSACAPACGSNLRGYKRPNGRRWYGHVAKNASDDNDCTIVMCQECYEDNVKDTVLATHLGRDLTEEVYAGDTQNQKEAFCGPFSKRSKIALREAKEKGDWTVFARHWNLRQRIRDSTLPLIKALQAEFAMQNAKKMAAMTNALTVQGGAMLSEAAGTDGFNHGNSVVGYGFQSTAGVSAAMWKRDADNTQWGDASNYTKIAMLEAQWKEVE